MLNFMRDLKDSLIAKVLLGLIIVGFLGIGFSGYSNLNQEAKLVGIGDHIIYSSEFEEFKQSVGVCNAISSQFQIAFSGENTDQTSLRQILAMAVIDDKLKNKEILVLESDKEQYRQQIITGLLKRSNDSHKDIFSLNNRVLMASLDRCQVFEIIFDYMSKEKNIIKSPGLKYYQIMNMYYGKNYKIKYFVIDGQEKFSQYLTHPLDHNVKLDFYNTHKNHMNNLNLHTIKFLEIKSNFVKTPSTDTVKTNTNEEKDIDDKVGNEQQNSEDDAALDALFAKAQEIQIMLDQNISMEELSNVLQNPMEQDLVLQYSKELKDMNIITEQQSQDIENSQDKTFVVELPQQKLPADAIMEVIKRYQALHKAGHGTSSPIMFNNDDQTRYFVVQYIPASYEITGMDDEIVSQLYRLSEVNRRTYDYANEVSKAMKNNELKWPELPWQAHEDTLNRANITRKIILRDNLSGYENLVGPESEESLENHLGFKQILRVINDIDLHFPKIDARLEEEQQSPTTNNGNKDKTDENTKTTTASTNNKTNGEDLHETQKRIMSSPDRFFIIKTAHSNLNHVVVIELQDITMTNTDINRTGSAIIEFGVLYSFSSEFVEGLLHEYWPRITLYKENIMDLYNIPKDQVEEVLHLISTTTVNANEGMTNKLSNNSILSRIKNVFKTLRTYLK